MKYAYGTPGWLIHLIHILVGIWLVYVGYMILTSKKINKVNIGILLILGIVMVAYQGWLWYKFPKKNYSLGLPGWVVHLTHIINGILFILISKDYFNKNFSGLYLIIMGSLAAAYHLHLWYMR